MLQVIKRDGRIVDFDRKRISEAIRKALDEAYGPPDANVDIAAHGAAVLHDGLIHDANLGMYGEDDRVSVEQIQDQVSQWLMARYPEAAERFVIYRHEHAKLRGERPIPDDVKAAFDESDAYFPTPLQKLQFFDKYSRYNNELGRRETWVETVDRSVAFLYELADDRLPSEIYHRLRMGILEMKVMPSMRLLAMAGPAARRQNACLYNCAFGGVDSLDSFVEALIISMSGTGYGFSVEEKYVSRLPTVRHQRPTYQHIKVVEDSTEGWAEALSYGLGWWFDGEDVAFDFSQIRPAGTPLLTKGGRASGPEPLKKMLDFCRSKILSRQGRRLRPIDAHDMMCAIGQGVVSGGVRRTAMISLFDEDDDLMLHAKDGDFAQTNSQRWNANNSAVTTMSDPIRFAEQFISMLKAGRGEPGIFNPQAALDTMPDRRAIGSHFGTNPCGEIILRSAQFCNLTSAVVRAGDTLDDLREKIQLATILGSIQSMATHFPGLRPEWKQNCEDERLLGVSLDGQMDSPAILTEKNLASLRRLAVFTNKNVAQSLGINQSAAVTCVKPSGNSSQLLDASSGIHARWAPYYIRNVRVSATSPLARVLKDAGVAMSPENGDDTLDPRTWVISFPVKAPDGAITRNDRSAVEQCEHWLKVKLHYTEHNPSVTITYCPDEVIELMGWVWDHREKIGGMSFLPAFDAKYDQLPYIEIDQAEYEKRVAEFPEIDFSKVYRYEVDDRTNASTTPACEGAVCLLDAGQAA